MCSREQKTPKDKGTWTHSGTKRANMIIVRFLVLSNCLLQRFGKRKSAIESYMVSVITEIWLEHRNKVECGVQTLDENTIS